MQREVPDITAVNSRPKRSSQPVLPAGAGRAESPTLFFYCGAKGAMAEPPILQALLAQSRLASQMGQSPQLTPPLRETVRNFPCAASAHRRLAEPGC